MKTRSIDEVYDATDAIQKERAKKGHLRHLAKIQPFLENLRNYAGVIEQFVQAKPDVPALIWGPVKLLLHWADNMKKSFDAIVDTFGDIGLALPEFVGMAQLFDQNNLIKDALVFFFRDILDLYLITLKFFRKSCQCTISVSSNEADKGLKTGRRSLTPCGPSSGRESMSSKAKYLSIPGF